MTVTLFWVYTITTFIAGSGAGASVGVSTSPEYRDVVACETARQQYEVDVMRWQTPTRRVSTLRCDLRARVDP